MTTQVITGSMTAQAYQTNTHAVDGPTVTIDWVATLEHNNEPANLDIDSNGSIDSYLFPTDGDGSLSIRVTATSADLPAVPIAIGLAIKEGVTFDIGTHLWTNPDYSPGWNSLATIPSGHDEGFFFGISGVSYGAAPIGTSHPRLRMAFAWTDPMDVGNHLVIPTGGVSPGNQPYTGDPTTYQAEFTMVVTEPTPINTGPLDNSRIRFGG